MVDRFGGTPVSEANQTDRFGGVAVTQEQPQAQPSFREQAVSFGRAIDESRPVQLAGEFAAGANRALLGLADFVSTDQFNAIAELMGSDVRAPSLADTLVPERGAIAGEGLPSQVAGTAGELGATALTAGMALRGATAQLPRFTAGESAGRGIARQFGQSTARQDVVGGALAGAGQEIGESVGGETGEIIGGVVAPLAVVPVGAASREANKLLKQAAPSVERLKETARGIYKSIDDLGVRLPSSQVDDLLDDITNTLRREGVDQGVTPKAFALSSRLQSEKGQAKTLSEIDTLRKVASGAAKSVDDADRRLGVIAIDKIDDFLDDLPVKVGDNKEVGQAFRSARDLWQRAKKTEIFEQAVEDARGQASGFENGLRVQFRAIAKKINRGKLKGFTQEEIGAIKKINEGTLVGNIARFLGKFGVLDGLTSRSLTTAAGSGLGAVAGGPVGAAAVPLAGQLSGALAQRMTVNNSRMADAIVRAGKNANKIAAAYVRNTPKELRDPNELAQLFLRNQVPVENINVSKIQPLIADAALIASIVKLNEEEE